MRVHAIKAAAEEARLAHSIAGSNLRVVTVDAAQGRSSFTLRAQRTQVLPYAHLQCPQYSDQPVPSVPFRNTFH